MIPILPSGEVDFSPPFSQKEAECHILEIGFFFSGGKGLLKAFNSSYLGNRDYKELGGSRA